MPVPALPPSFLELLHRNRVEAVAEVPCGEPGMAAFLVIAPIREQKSTEWETKLAPTAAYELRYFRHKREFTDTDWGDDYDLVLADPHTRLRRETVPRTPDGKPLALALARYGADPEAFERALPCPVDSALVCNYYDWFFDHPEQHPHLWLPGGPAPTPGSPDA